MLALASRVDASVPIEVAFGMASKRTILGVVRDGERLDMTVRTQRQLYRKSSIPGVPQ